MIARVNGNGRSSPAVLSRNGDAGVLRPPNSRARERELERLVRSLNKRFGQRAIMKLGEDPLPDVEVISTGFPGLDRALGVGGLPRGRIIDIYGPESSGKTTLCLKVIAESQKAGGLCAFIDMERALDLRYAAHCGVRASKLYIARPDTGEEALEIADALVRAKFDVVVIDSAAALTPRAELEGEMGASHAGLQARLISQALRKLAGPLQENNTLLIFTNQLRAKIGVLFGNPETSTGGRALRFYASVRIDLRRIQAVKSGGEVIGNRFRATVKKNKVATPYRSAEFEILFPEK